MAIVRGRARGLARVLWLAVLTGCGPQAGDLRLELVQDPSVGWVVELRGLDPDRLAAAASGETGAGTLEVFTAERDDVAVLGAVAVSGPALRWRPTFPLAPGQRYRAVWAAAAAAPFELDFTPPATATAPPRVTAVLPDVATVPANLLRAYVHFSEPMRIGQVVSHVAVLVDGRPLEGALVQAEAELWDPERTRLTLLFDPGRIKQQVGPNLEVGAPLQAGSELELRIEPGWRSTAGRALAEPVVRRWRIGPEDRERPSSHGWRVDTPGTSGGHDPVVVDLPEALDAALLERLVGVETASGQAVAGVASVEAGGTRWGFRPERPWPPGDYRLRVAPEIEDLAGNSLERLFDEPLDGEVGEPEAEDVLLPFAISEPRRP